MASPEIHREPRCVRRGRKNWPYAYYQGVLTECGKPIMRCGYEDRSPGTRRQNRREIVRQIEQASGIQLADNWRVVPLNCNDHFCSNYHHWRVVREFGAASPPLPNHPGFIQLAADEMEQVQRIVDARRDHDETPRTVQACNPSRLYTMIESALLVRWSRERP